MTIFRRAGAAVARILSSASDPAAASDQVQLYAKLASGVSQLFARASDGTITQLTPHLKPSQQAQFFDDIMSGGAWWFEYNANENALLTINASDSGISGPFMGFARLWFNSGISTGIAFAPAAYAVSNNQGSVGGQDGLRPVNLIYDGTARTEWRVEMLSTPSSMSDYEAFIGLLDNVGGGIPPAKGVYFRAGFGLNGNGNWWAINMTGAETAVQDTGVAVSTSFVNLAIEVDITNFESSSRYYINDVLVSTINNLGYVWGFIPAVSFGSASTLTSHEMVIDYLDFTYTLDRTP